MGAQLAVLKGGPCDGEVRAISASVFVVPLMPEMPGVWDPELGGFVLDAAEDVMALIPPFTEARYRATDEISDGYVVYQFESG